MLGVGLVLPCEVKVLDERSVGQALRKQRTISREISLSGNGLFTGIPVTIKLLPADVGTGIVFRRVDLPGKPTIKAHVDNVCGTSRCTILGKDSVQVQSVEHILSALAAFEIDNLVIELDACEIPVGDGSALPFVSLLQAAEMQEQSELIQSYYLSEPIYWSDGKVHLVALPSKKLQFSYTLSYPGHPLLNAQFYTFEMDGAKYVEEIAPCRTFSLYEEVLALLEKGVLKGGTLMNGVVVKGSEVLNPDGLRFPDEMVRHKMLDLIGDTSLMGIRVIAHFIAIRSGHFSNTELAKRILAHVKGVNN